jgi:hypothetical protein
MGRGQIYTSRMSTSTVPVNDTSTGSGASMRSLRGSDRRRGDRAAKMQSGNVERGAWIRQSRGDCEMRERGARRRGKKIRALN